LFNTSYRFFKYDFCCSGYGPDTGLAQQSSEALIDPGTNHERTICALIYFNKNNSICLVHCSLFFFLPFFFVSEILIINFILVCTMSCTFFSLVLIPRVLDAALFDCLDTYKGRGVELIRLIKASLQHYRGNGSI
jgi:hypothetical protein